MWWCATGPKTVQPAGPSFFLLDAEDIRHTPPPPQVLCQTPSSPSTRCASALTSGLQPSTRRPSHGQSPWDTVSGVPHPKEQSTVPTLGQGGLFLTTVWV